MQLDTPRPSRWTRREWAAWALLAGASPASGQAHFGSMLWDYLREYLRLLDERRASRLAALATPEEFETLRTRVRKELARMWGAFPERTPLRPRQVGVLDRGDHQIERVLFESQESLPVTANLYRPREHSGKLPALVFPCGHSSEGKAFESYQRFAALMARNGFVVLTWDPVGQGERLQFPDPESGASVFGAGTPEHGVLGRQSYLLGENLMQYRAWDVTRALDYLELRPEVDTSRIGMAGQSGGGMTTLQFACFDDRIQAAFVSCAVASFRAKTEALLIADAEQILYGTLRAGIDHPELLAAFAPKPLLIGAAIRDYVPIEGARRTYGELQAVYRKLGAEDALAIAETDAGHGLNQELREAAAAFFRRSLGDSGEIMRETDEELPSASDLACTSNGQVASEPEWHAVPEINARKADKIGPRFALPQDASEFEVYQAGVANRIREVTRVGAFRPEHGIEVPTRFLDAGVYGKGTVFLVADQGKDHPFVRRYCIDPVVAADYSLYGLDLRGWGITAPSMPALDVRFDWDDFFAYRSLELGRPLFGQRLKDLLTAAPQLTKRREWIVAGIGIGGLVAAHAASLDPRVAGVVSIDAPLSYRSLLDDPQASQPLSCLLPGVLGAYEIRDVYASVAPRPLLILNPQDARRRSVPSEVAMAELGFAARVYDAVEAPGAIAIESGLGHSDVRSRIGSWLDSVS